MMFGVSSKWVMEYISGVNKINSEYIDKIYDLQEKRIKQLESQVSILIKEHTEKILLKETKGRA